MYLSKLRRIEYKEPHQACANFLAINNCLILAIYYELTEPSYVFGLFLMLGASFFSISSIIYSLIYSEIKVIVTLC